MIIVVSALNDAYKSMNSPSKLKGWSSSGGDPCGDSWDGITCKGSSVTEMFVIFSLIKYFSLMNQWF